MPKLPTAIAVSLPRQKESHRRGAPARSAAPVPCVPIRLVASQSGQQIEFDNRVTGVAEEEVSAVLRAISGPARYRVVRSPTSGLLNDAVATNKSDAQIADRCDTVDLNRRQSDR